MVWVSMTHGRRTDFIYLERFLNAVDYRGIIIGTVVVPFTQQAGPHLN